MSPNSRDGEIDPTFLGSGNAKLKVASLKLLCQFPLTTATHCYKLKPKTTRTYSFTVCGGWGVSEMQNEFPQAEIKVLRGRFPSETLEKKDSVFLSFPGSRDASITFLGVCPLLTPPPQVALERRA